MRAMKWIGKGKKQRLVCMVIIASLAICARASAQEWWKKPLGPACQILVYSFADSDGDGWGDIQGLIDKLDYLNSGDAAKEGDLGVEAIWLSPIHPSASYHGYDVIDYEGVSPKLGSLSDFERLCAECHKRGIRVIMDMVFNHSGQDHPWFTAFQNDPDGPYGEYYVKRNSQTKYGTKGKGEFYPVKGSGAQREYFSSFGEGMPDLNCANPAVRAELKSILAFWISHGADGFRFDAVKHIFDPNELAAGADSVAMNLAFWKDLRAFAKGKKADVFFIGEVMSDYSSEIAAYAPCMDSLFDFPAAKRIMGALPAGSDSAFLPAYEKALTAYGKIPGFVPAPFLSNHDQDRSMGVFLSRSGVMGTKGWGPDPADDEVKGKAKALALARAKIAATMLFTLPGLPFIYYGEELGMTGRRYLGDDIARRDAFPWNDSRLMSPNSFWARASGKLEAGQNDDTPSAEKQSHDRDSLLWHYRRLSEFMRSEGVLREGRWEKVDWPGLADPGLIAYARVGGQRRLLIVHNLSQEPKPIRAAKGIALTPVFGNSKGIIPRIEADPPRGDATIAALDSMIFSY
jgi:alpha-amylase